MMRQEIPEEVVTDILWRLPISDCIARFQCVCKSWRDLLSDPSFILRDNQSADSDLQIMINFTNDDDDRRSMYSLYSAGTLEPLLPSPVPLPFNPEVQGPPSDDDDDHWDSQVAGCCNGLICISGGRTDDHLVLWNPATSETKVIRPSPFYRPHNLKLRAVGFGFDSETNDYKILRQLDRNNGGSWRGRCFLEVYSLRNNTWKKLSADYEYDYGGGGGGDDDDDDDYDGYKPRLPYRRIPQWNKGKLYWWNMRYRGKKRSLLFDSFDMSSHEFQELDLPCPPCENAYGRPECSMKEETMVALFALYDSDDGDVQRYPTSWEIWVLLKYGVSESWTRLVVISTSSPPSRGIMNNIVVGSFGISRNSKGLFVAVRSSSSSMINGYNYDDADDDDRGSDMSLIGFRPETGEFSNLGLEIRGRRSLVMVDYMPSHVCMCDLYI